MKQNEQKMTKYIILLRGINVGGHRKVPMAELRELFTKSGFKNVQTYIQSGNVFLESSDNSKKIKIIAEELILQHFGFEVTTLVKTESELNFSDEEKDQLKYVEMISNAFKKHDKVLRQEMNVESYNRESLTKFTPTSIIGKEAKLGILSLHKLMQLDEQELNTYTIAQIDELTNESSVAAIMIE